MQRVNKKKTILERLSSSNIRYDNDVLENLCNKFAKEFIKCYK